MSTSVVGIPGGGAKMAADVFISEPIAFVRTMEQAHATFEWLDRAWSNRDSAFTILLSDPLMLRFKDDPRFAAFCRKVGLPVRGEAPAGRPT